MVVRILPVRVALATVGLELSAADASLAVAEARGLIERDLHSIRPTLRGQRFLNDLLELFLPPGP